MNRYSAILVCTILFCFLSNLGVASQQNTQQRNHTHKSITVGASIGANGSGLLDFNGAFSNFAKALGDIDVNVGFLGFNYERDKRNRVFTDNPTKIVGQEEVKINVAGRTHVKGAVIASEQGDVDLKTNSFSHENLKDEDKHSKTKVSGFVLDDPLNPGPRRSLKDVLPAVDVQHEKTETEGITRATIAAPNGEEIITITVAPEASLEGLNRTLEKAQEIVREEKKSVRIVIAAPLFAPLETVEEVGDALENLVKGFEQLSQHLVGSPLQKLPEQMKNQVTYLESLGYEREAIYNVLSNPTYQKIITGITSTINEGEVKGYFSKEDRSSGKYFTINLGPTAGEEILLEAVQMKDFIGGLPAEEAAITIAGMQMALGPVKFVSSVTIQTIGQIFGREYIEDTKDTIAEKLMFIARGDWRYGKQYRKEIETIVGPSRDANPDSVTGQKFAGARFIVDVMAGGVVLRKGGLAKKPDQKSSSLNNSKILKKADIALPNKIHSGQQGKHIKGHNNYVPGRSRLIRGIKAQDLLNGVHEGTYPIIRVTPQNRPVVNFGKTIGKFNGQPTKYGIIHHGKKGAHIVPANPVQK